MNFKDGAKNDVQSLLAMLRTSQDATPAAATTTPARPAPQGRTSSPNASRSGSWSANQTAVPSKRQLDDLLSSLNQNSQPAVDPPQQGSTGSAFQGTRQNLIEPFGPVGQAGPSRMLFDANVRDSRALVGEETDVRPVHQSISGGVASAAEPAPSSSAKAKGKQRMSPDDPSYAMMSFKEALPILSELLENDSFIKELRKMKTEQDTLERRLWAKQEKIKAEHEHQIKTDTELARIARRPIPPEKKAASAQKLREELQTFYTSTCLPSIDGLSSRHRARLKELGVPGLGNGDKLENGMSVERCRRIMDVLQAGLE